MSEDENTLFYSHVTVFCKTTEASPRGGDRML